jgi:hypothetical protein
MILIHIVLICFKRRMFPVARPVTGLTMGPAEQRPSLLYLIHTRSFLSLLCTIGSNVYHLPAHGPFVDSKTSMLLMLDDTYLNE